MQSSSEVSGIIHGWFTAVANGDGAWADAHLSSQLRVIGTDPGEVLQGAEAVEFLKREALGLAKLASFEIPEPEGFVEGTVGWGFGQPVIHFNDGPTVSPRWTCVVLKEADGWKIVQIHASIGIGNDDAGYTMPA